MGGIDNFRFLIHLAQAESMHDDHRLRLNCWLSHRRSQDYSMSLLSSRFLLFDMPKVGITLRMSFFRPLS